MKIIFDLFSTQPFATHVKYNGGAEYVKNIFINFILENKVYKNEIYGLYDSRFEVDSKILKLCKEFNVQLLDIKKHDIEFYAILFKVDKIYIGIVQRYLNFKIPKDIEIIAVVHDLRDLEIFPSRSELFRLTKLNTFKGVLKLFLILAFYRIWKFYRYESNYRRYFIFFTSLTQSNSQIWAVSNHTKYILLSKFLFIESNNIKVYWSPEINANVKVKVVTELKHEKFYLMIASNNWEKNALRVIDAFTELNNNNITLKLVIIGDIDSTILDLQIKKHSWIYNLSNIENSEIEWVYSNAQALIYLSYVEGFGYPPLQSMKHGTPVLASSTSSIMEVCGDAPVYCCPYSDSEIIARLTFFLSTDHSILKYKCSNRYYEINVKQKKDLVDMIKELHS